MIPFADLKTEPGRARKRARRKFEADARKRGRRACAGKVRQDVVIANDNRREDGKEPIFPAPPPAATPNGCVPIRPWERVNRQTLLSPTVAENSAQPLVVETDEFKFSRAYRLLDRLRPISKNSTAQCRRFRIAKDVQIFCDGQTVKVSGVCTCHNGWGCPVCALAIQIRRGGEIETAIERWKGDGPIRLGPWGATAYMLTGTVRHGISHKLRETSGLIIDAWGNFFAGRAGQELRRRLGIQHSIRALEATWGPENGWHPHLHIVILTSRPLNLDEQAELDQRWHDAIQQAVGYREAFKPNEEHGFKCTELWRKSDGRYLQKMFRELSDFGSKEADEQNLTYWEVADRAALGDQRMIRVWLEAQKALFRKKQLTWSHGSKEALGILDLTDETLADEDGVAAPNLAETLQIQIPGRVWDAGFRADPLFLSTTLAAIQHATRSGDYSSLLALLSERLSRQGGGFDCGRETRDFCSALARQLSYSLARGSSEAGAVGAVVSAR